MEIRIAENIRAFRKKMKLTQEQLAEALRVSVGAVSKWELGASVPDISLIMELANFFETSVDVLLGYEWHAHSAGEASKRLRELRFEKKLEEGMRDAEKALIKYPHSFDVVYQSAMIYYLAIDDASSRRALTLFQRALELIEQNTDDRISTVSIQNHMAVCYQITGQFDDAIALLKKNNFDGLNDAQIGCILSNNCRKYEEALPYLSDALGNCQNKLFRVVVSYANSYVNTGRFQETLEMLLWLLRFDEGLKIPGKVMFLDKGDAVVWSVCASVALELGRPEDARVYLKNARDTALRFDAAPEYGMRNIKYYHGKEATAFDDMGDTAMDGVLGHLRGSDHAAALLPMWEEICNEK